MSGVASAGSRTESSTVLPFTLADVPAVAALRRRVFRLSERATTAASEDYFARVFFDNPWVDQTLPSLVLRDADGTLIGFLGVLPRPMVWRGRPLRAAVPTQFMVAPEHRGLAGRTLMATFLDGPQDLSFSDAANSGARRLWESLGGATSMVQSISWFSVVRPVRNAARRLARGLPGRLALAACGALIDTFDMFASRRTPSAMLTVGPLDAASMASALPNLVARDDLRPDYGAAGLEWLLAMAAEKHQFGRLEGGLVRDPGGAIVGWFLYYLDEDGEARVFQLIAKRQARGDILRRCLDDARSRGATIVSGRLEPVWLDEVSHASSALGREDPWVLMHSRRPELLQAINSGEAHVSRLEGEGWLSF